tara:strand:+ start:10658 stop:10840 length:183 start_codon:yes stop_codon:yes gene_type:complete
MPDNIYNFVQWMRSKTTHIQDNVVLYKGIHYFLDRKTETGRKTDAGADDLWNVYVKETIG